MARSDSQHSSSEAPGTRRRPGRLRRTDAALAMFTCPACDRAINQASEVCPYCGASLTRRSEATARRAGLRARRQALLKAMVAAGLIAAGIWALIWFVLPHRPASSAGKAEASAVRSLAQLGQALAAYAGDEHSYPASLEQLGSRAALTLKQAEANGYRIVYSPGPFASDGNIHTYTLLARPRFYGDRNFYLDQTGVTRATRENRPATARDQPF
jgi:hypothetical protein